MLKFNSYSVILPSELGKPSIGFDADLYKLKIKNTDFRDNPTITYMINGTSYTSNGLSNYDLPEIDKEYSLNVTLTPTKGYLKQTNTVKNIFKNSILCRDFIYDGNYDSTRIKAYKGTNSNIVIPDKHNLIYTTSAEILEFPNVSSSTIQITTPLNMTSFNIRDDRITEFTIKGDLEPIDYQFANLPNLENIKASFNSCSNYMFANCPKLNMDPNNTRHVRSIGEKAFYDTPSQKIVAFSANTIESGAFDYSTDGVQKVLFTSASSINGLNNKTLISGTYTGGMLYNSDKKHQVYCDVSKVPDGVPTNLVPKFVDFNYSNSTIHNGKTVPAGCGVFSLTDENIIGFHLKATTSSGSLRGEAFCIPSTTSPGTEVIARDNLYWYIPMWYFYSGNTANVEDRWSFTPIDRNGLTGTTTTITLSGGSVSDKTPSVALKKLIYTAGASGEIKYTIDGSQGILTTTSPSYLLIVQYDKDFPEVRITLHDSDGGFVSDDNSNVYSANLTLSGNNKANIHLDSYFPKKYLTSSYKVRIYYSGYASSTSVYMSLTKQLIGNTD